MKKSTIFYVLTAIIGPMIIVALYPITFLVLARFARHPEDIYLLLFAYWCIVLPICTTVLSWILSSQLITKTKRFRWAVNIYIPNVTAIYVCVLICIANGKMLTHNHMFIYAYVSLWLLLWSAVGTLLATLKYKKTLKKEQELLDQTEIMP